MRSRASRESSFSLEKAIVIPNRRWMTPSWMSRARSMRSCSWRARSCWVVATRAWVASATVLPIVHSR